MCLDETRYLAGYPGKDAVIARRKGKAWYIGGINGEQLDKDISIDLSHLVPEGTGLELIQDGGEQALLQKSTVVPGGNSFTVHLQPFGGFVATIGLDDQ